MIYHTHPRTGHKLSAIGFGGMRFRDQNDREACAQLLLDAYNAGINYFDTAPGYGKSEELYGLAIREMKKSRQEKPFYLATKTFADTPDKLRRDLENSLTRLGVDYIDYYHFWCVLSLEAYQRRKPILKEFEKLKDEGLIRHICVSTHMKGEEIAPMLDDYPFESILLGYSAMNFMFREKGIEAAAQRKLGVVVMNPLGGGIIPRNPERFEFLKDPGDPSVVQGALRFLLSDPRITVALVGFSDTRQLQDALLAVKDFKPWSKERIDATRQQLRSAFNEMCTGCAYCDNCPVELPIPKLMDAYNQYMFDRNKQSAINRLRYHWSLLRESDFYRQCIECGACEQACTQHLPIIERIKELAEMVEEYQAQQQ